MATQACCIATHSCGTVVGWLFISEICTTIWSQRCSMVLISGLLEGQSMSWFSRKILFARALGQSIFVDQDEVVLKGGSCPGLEILLQHTPVHLLVHDAVQHNQFTFATIVKSSLYNDRWTGITICSLLTDINVPPILPTTWWFALTSDVQCDDLSVGLLKWDLTNTYQHTSSSASISIGTPSAFLGKCILLTRCSEIGNNQGFDWI